jgi:hypothetical protein
MPSTERHVPWRAISSVTTTGAVGLFFGSVPAWHEPLTATAAAGFVLFGVVALSLSVAGFLIWFKKPHPPVAYVAASEGPALRVGLSSHHPWARLLVGICAAAFTVWAAVAARPGSLLLLPLVALPLALVPDSARAIWRRPHVTLTAAGLRLVGWAVDAEVGWEDVQRSEFVLAHQHRAVLRVHLRRPAPSLRERYLRTAQRLDAPRQDAVDIPLLALGQPGRLGTLIDHLAASDPARRASMIRPEGVAFLSGDRSAPPDHRGPAGEFLEVPGR